MTMLIIIKRNENNHEWKSIEQNPKCNLTSSHPLKRKKAKEKYIQASQQLNALTISGWWQSSARGLEESQMLFQSLPAASPFLFKSQSENIFQVFMWYLLVNKWFLIANPIKNATINSPYSSSRTYFSYQEKIPIFNLFKKQKMRKKSI